MKDSLILEGKTYISARRASKIMSYAQDYIGQLCRAGKLDCKMVGRSWFVTEESLIAHRESILDTPEEKITKVVKNQISVVTVPVQSENKFEYVPEKTPLLPELRKRVPAHFSIPVLSRQGASVRAAFSYNPIVVTVIVFIFTFSSLLFTNSFSNISDSASRSGQLSAASTSVGSAMYDVVEKFMNALLELTDFSPKTIVENVPTSRIVVAPSAVPSVEPFANFNGIGVLPSTMSTTTDEAAKLKIRNTFSDEVTVRPDQSGTAGVITPVFKKTDGKDFVYVLVPVKEKKEQKNATAEKTRIK